MSARIAVVGLNHGYSLAQAIRSCEEAELVGLCTRSPYHHRNKAEELKAPIFSDLESMLAETAPDGVIIAAPTDQLVPIAKTCLAHHVNVLIEKPLGVSVADVLELKYVCDATDARVLVGYYRRLSRQVLELKRLLASGVIGQVSGLCCKWVIYKPPEYFQGWKAARARGGGCLMINVIHDFDLLQNLFGPIEAVAAMQTDTRPGDDLEHFLVINMHFRSGQLATATVSDQCPSPYSYENTVAAAGRFPLYGADTHHFFGTRGSLAFPSFTVYASPSPHSTWRDPLHRSVASDANDTVDDPIALEVQRFIAVLRGRAQPHATVEDALINLAVVEAIRRSLDTARTEPVRIGSLST